MNKIGGIEKWEDLVQEPSPSSAPTAAAAVTSSHPNLHISEILRRSVVKAGTVTPCSKLVLLFSTRAIADRCWAGRCCSSLLLLILFDLYLFHRLLLQNHHVLYYFFSQAAAWNR